jgi:hypothetical protein
MNIFNCMSLYINTYSMICKLKYRFRLYVGCTKFFRNVLLKGTNKILPNLLETIFDKIGP